ncbi:MAG: T9SS type A sorting domain-containing protein [Ignavibacteriae bacterium]|nr:T9SS type A sorting domain-containing protein [Ignavibacteriota bacterium]MCB9216804.1 T9SS type A sorting domain-containing protein [Ignavibacteria bacterium]
MNRQEQIGTRKSAQVRANRNRLRGEAAVFAACLLLLSLPHLQLISQSRIVRGTFGSGGGSTGSGVSGSHGTLSQSIVGRTGGASQGETFHDAGFWRRGLLPNSETVVVIPATEAPVGLVFTIPIDLQSVTGSLLGATRPYKLRLRYNATLLEPTGDTPQPLRVGDTCFLDITGNAVLLPGTFAKLQFRAKLGNDTSTPLTIEEFLWEISGEERNRITTIDGTFTLLGVCREGDSVRLIHSGPSAARITLQPNPARTEAVATYTTAESGQTDLTLFDMMGKEVARLATFNGEAEQIYRIELDLQSIPSGAYTVVCRTPSETIIERLMISQ